MDVISYNCEYCGKNHSIGKYYYNRAKHHFCSRSCHMKYMNEKLNPYRMTEEVKEKIRQKRLGDSSCKSYEKTHGRHTHRIVAEQKMGRPLQPGEIVHHIDGNKRNNDPSNLEVMTQAEHCKLHFTKVR